MPICSCSIHPDDVPYLPDARHTSIIRPDDVFFPSGPYTVSRSFCASLHTFGSLSSPSRRLSVFDQLQILSKFRIRKDRYIRPDDVVSRPEARLHKARIAIQISRSGRKSALVRTPFIKGGNFRFDFNCPDNCSFWSERAHCRYGNCVLKFNRPDAHPSWSGSGKPYMEVTCGGRATVRTSVSHRPEAALKQ
jgi:hypothetical protein